MVSGRVCAAALSLAVLLPACSRKPKEVRVTPARSTIFGLKRTMVLSAKVVDTKGVEIPGPEIRWESEKPAVATVDDKGVVTAQKPGRASVKAIHKEISGTATVEVVDAASVTVAPLRITLAGPAGSKATFHAVVKSEKGEVVDARPRWISSDPAVATVDGNGVVTSVKPGRVTISATLGEVANAADLVVTSRSIAQFDARPKTVILRVGDTQLLTPTALDGAGQEIADPAVEWTSSDPATATVIDGLVTGKAPGTATVTASAGGKTSEVSVLVN